MQAICCLHPFTTCDILMSVLSLIVFPTFLSIFMFDYCRHKKLLGIYIMPLCLLFYEKKIWFYDVICAKTFHTLPYFTNYIITINFIFDKFLPEMGNFTFEKKAFHLYFQHMACISVSKHKFLESSFWKCAWPCSQTSSLVSARLRLCFWRWSWSYFVHKASS